MLLYDTLNIIIVMVILCRFTVMILLREIDVDGVQRRCARKMIRRVYISKVS